MLKSGAVFREDAGPPPDPSMSSSKKRALDDNDGDRVKSLGEPVHDDGVSHDKRKLKKQKKKREKELASPPNLICTFYRGNLIHLCHEFSLRPCRPLPSKLRICDLELRPSHSMSVSRPSDPSPPLLNVLSFLNIRRFATSSSVL